MILEVMNGARIIFDQFYSPRNILELYDLWYSHVKNWHYLSVSGSMIKKMTECITTWESILDSYFLKPDNFLKSDPSFLSSDSLLLLQWSYRIETQFLENSNATKIHKIHCITLINRVIFRHGILFVENEILKWYQKSPTPGDD